MLRSVYVRKKMKKDEKLVRNTWDNSNSEFREEVTDLTKFPNEKNDFPKLSKQFIYKSINKIHFI